MINITMTTQPDGVTCGPTSLHSIYQHFDDPISIQQVIKEVTSLETGGTLAVLLGNHALKRGYRVELFSYNLQVMDPTWFRAPRHIMIKKLKQQLQHKKNRKLQVATEAYMRFLKLGGKLYNHNLTPHLLRKYFEKKIPILVGLNSTYLYNCMREYTGPNNQVINDDVKGYPCGHFVVLCGYDAKERHVVVADPYSANPVSGDNYYSVKVSRLINSIMLGIMTYDANLLIIYPAKKQKKSETCDQ